ncbi:hypothetical protein GA0074696_4863 [Micromonospora purpureochromogenes]|uniref:Uncharacterized protein n=1 Tax=Micromonospora purpureochromogenes TaxID=47872 RepID=A0A1C4ZT75_9ACTN|nr:hypothetical protein GA0074696_4863 [Micromonospora purpureochromogenes]
MTLYISQHAFAGTTDIPHHLVPVSVRVVTDRAAVSPGDPPLLTHVWQRVFAQRTDISRQR